MRTKGPRPLIGITMSGDSRPAERDAAQDAGGRVSLSARYVRAVRAAGGLPLLLPSGASPEEIGELAPLLDGLLFSGGGDVAPTLFGEEPIAKVRSISTERDEFEIGLFRAARARSLPVFAICRGCQLVNVAMGGTLYQDIPQQFPQASGHYPEGLPFDEPYHGIEPLAGGRLLRKAFGEGRILVNSFHHQAVKDLAPGLVLAAVSSDGIVEAFEGEEGPFLLAVQFHPEGMAERFAPFQRLFDIFVEACRNR